MHSYKDDSQQVASAKVSSSVIRGSAAATAASIRGAGAHAGLDNQLTLMGNKHAVDQLRTSMQIEVDAKLAARLQVESSPVGVTTNVVAGAAVGKAEPNREFLAASHGEAMLQVSGAKDNPMQLSAGAAAQPCSAIGKADPNNGEQEEYKQDPKLLKAIHELAKEEIPGEFVCSLTLEPISDPVIARDGITYERAKLEEWLADHDTSPMTNEKLADKTLTPNIALRSRIQAYKAESVARRQIAQLALTAFTAQDLRYAVQLNEQLSKQYQAELQDTDAKIIANANRRIANLEKETKMLIQALGSPAVQQAEEIQRLQKQVQGLQAKLEGSEKEYLEQVQKNASLNAANHRLVSEVKRQRSFPSESAEALYQHGLSCVQQNNLAEAVWWFERAGRKGHAMAQCKLGTCYYSGRGIEQDLTQAVDWYKASAQRNNALAQYNLGACYERGEGVPANREQAMKWYQSAARQNEHNAQEALHRLGSSRTVVRRVYSSGKSPAPLSDSKHVVDGDRSRSPSVASTGSASRSSNQGANSNSYAPAAAAVSHSPFFSSPSMPLENYSQSPSVRSTASTASAQGSLTPRSADMVLAPFSSAPPSPGPQ
jgi:hypothetical protein